MGDNDLRRKVTFLSGTKTGHRFCMNNSNNCKKAKRDILEAAVSLLSVRYLRYLSIMANKVHHKVCEPDVAPPLPSIRSYNDESLHYIPFRFENQRTYVHDHRTVDLTSFSFRDRC